MVRSLRSYEQKIPCISSGGANTKSVMSPHQQKQLKGILQQGSVIPMILKTQLKSMREDLERTFLICKGQVIPIAGTNSSVDSVVYLSGDQVNNMCKGDRNRVYFHNHGNFFSDPSLIDHDAFDLIFRLPNTKFACSSGVEGVSCVSRNRSEIKIPWGFKFDETFTRRGSGKIDYGDALFCDRVGENQYDCRLQWRKYGKNLGRFNHIILNSSTFTLNDGADLSHYVHHPKDLIKCITTTSKNRANVLICQKISGERIISNDGVPPQQTKPCDTLNICQMEAPQ